MYFVFSSPHSVLRFCFCDEFGKVDYLDRCFLILGVKNVCLLCARTVLFSDVKKFSCYFWRVVTVFEILGTCND